MNHNIWKNRTLWFITTGTCLRRKKVFNYWELHFSEVTSYKIHNSTLFQQEGADYAHHITASIPGFENLTTYLQDTDRFILF